MYELSGLVITISVASYQAQLSAEYDSEVNGDGFSVESDIVSAVLPSSAFTNSPIFLPWSVVSVEPTSVFSIAEFLPPKC